MSTSGGLGASTPTCVRCRPNCADDSSNLKLQCEHSICRKCLIGNAKLYGPDKMYTCPECPDPNKVWVFVDCSNVWITAKKSAAKKKFGTNEDSRLRISWGSLIKVVASDEEGMRRVARKPKLYLSKPQGVGSVWEKLEDIFEVNLIDRDQSGKEVGVDDRIIGDVTSLATKGEVEPSTIILVTGDEDFKPAIETALQKGWRVEVYAWKCAFSQKLQGIQRCKCQDLDPHLEEVTFIRPYLKQDKWSNFPLLRLKIRTFPTDENSERNWWAQLEEVSKWTVQGQWKNDDPTSKEFILVFQHKESSDEEHRLALQSRNRFLDIWKQRVETILEKTISEACLY